MSKLLSDQISIIGSNARCIFDIGSHTGATTLEYLDHFPEARLLALEPEPSNFDTVCRTLAPYYERVDILDVALGQSDGRTVFHVNSHNGTHSLLPIGDISYWAAPEKEIAKIEVRMRSLDSIAAERNIDLIDIVKMDIQGGELLALKGATELLSKASISALVLEVEFKPLYDGQPMFWDICAYLQNFGYSFYNLYEPFYHPRNERTLCWSDAIFLSPRLCQI
ncbi:FkbM family methyltransferase [Tardiphaga sp. 839_C3_N1_4]|uniref:FkbM family methyltransferase n=1 Tax=Tardiphaga sp. 839_C3_N1_4 TaxID=3240761 RepID=UPI003F264511